MSIAATHWAFNQPNLSGIAKNILSALAFRANNDLTCFPSVPRIAQDVGCSERSVQKKMKELEQLGLVERIFRKYEKGGNRSNFYRIVGFAAPISTPQKNQKSEPTASLAGESRSPSPLNTVHQDGEHGSPINKTLKNNSEKNNNTPPENPPMCEPIVVVSEEIVSPTIPHSEPIKPAIVETVSTQQTTESFQPVPDMKILDTHFDDQEKRLAISELKRVTNITHQAVILFVLKDTIANDKIEKTPIALLLGLIKKEENGLLTTKALLAKMKKAHEDAKPKPVVPQLSVEERKVKEQAIRVAQLKELVARQPESVAAVKQKGAFYFGSRGVFFREDFERAGFDVARDD